MMQTADNWGTDPQQCMVPGFAGTRLYVNNVGNVMNPIASFPITYDQKKACGYVVFSTPIVDRTNPIYVYGQMYVWKDYFDVLYVTVSLNATGFGPGPEPAFNAMTYPVAPANTKGQFLFTSPSSANPGAPSAWINLWNQNVTVSGYESANYLSSEIFALSSLQSWSCFTFKIDLKTVCNPSNSFYKAGYGCMLRNIPDSPPGDSVDLSASSSLFFSAQFNLTRYYMNSASSLYCGDLAGSYTPNYANDQVVAQMLSASVDLYNVGKNARSLPKACSTMSAPPSPPLPPSPPSPKPPPPKPPPSPPNSPPPKSPPPKSPPPKSPPPLKSPPPKSPPPKSPPPKSDPPLKSPPPKSPPSPKL